MAKNGLKICAKIQVKGERECLCVFSSRCQCQSVSNTVPYLSLILSFAKDKFCTDMADEKM